MNLLNKKDFFKIQKEMSYISPFQDINWILFKNILDKKIIYFVDNILNPKICCWGSVTNKLFGVKILTITGHSTIMNIERNDFVEFYSSIKNFGLAEYSLIKVSIESLYDVNFEVGVREAGFIRPLVYSNCPLSICIDIDQEKFRSRNWNRQYNSALKNKLVFKHIEYLESTHLMDLVYLHKQMTINKKLNGNLNLMLVQKLITNSKYHLFICYSEDNIPLCARIIYLNNDFSYDIIAANGRASRTSKGSNHFLMENIFKWLKAKGCKKFDFGRIGPSLDSTNSVYEFKRYSGGQLIPLNGEWIYPIKKWVEYLLLLKQDKRW
jgi:hypothetical protein